MNTQTALCENFDGMRLCSLLLSIIAVLLLAGCQQEPVRRETRPIVKTMRVKIDTSFGDRTYSGVVVARHEVEESFRVDGRIARRMVDVGDRVQAGQVLATLDENDLRLTMESSLAEHRAAKSNREQMLTDERRYSTLLSNQVVSQSEYDVRQLAADEAKGRLDRAERTLRLAQNRLEYAHLISSTDGVVTKVSAEAGQVVSPGQAVVSVAKDGDLEVLVDIPESSIRHLDDVPAEMTLWSKKDGRYSAVLREISPNADPVTRTFAVRYSLRDADSSIRLGMTATLHLSDSTATPAARVPASALFNQGDGVGVWVVAPETGRLSFKNVDVDRYVDRDAYVHGALADGDVIVVAGVHKLDPDVEVRLASADREGQAGREALQ